MKLAIEGMSCGHCVAAVEKALKAVPGAKVEKVVVGEAVVAGTPSEAAVLEAVRDAGYEARVVAGGP